MPSFHSACYCALYSAFWRSLSGFPWQESLLESTSVEIAVDKPSFLCRFDVVSDTPIAVRVSRPGWGGKDLRQSEEKCGPKQRLHHMLSSTKAPVYIKPYNTLTLFARIQVMSNIPRQDFIDFTHDKCVELVKGSETEEDLKLPFWLYWWDETRRDGTWPYVSPYVIS